MNYPSIYFTTEDVSFRYDFLSCFQSALIPASKPFKLANKYQQYNNDMAKKIEALVDKYEKENKKINQIKSFFKNLKENEWFYVCEKEIQDICDKYQVELELRRRNGIDNTLFNYNIKAIQEILTKYDIVSITTEQSCKVGESFKSNRICRFCGKQTPEVTFNNKAHAISESLGNKKIILNEECDICNTKFSKIENEFAIFHNVDRFLCNVKNKNGKLPKLTNLSFYSKDFSMQSTTKDLNSEQIQLIDSVKITPQNIYKALCKFALSITDKKYLNFFEETIKWINQDNCEKINLPNIFILNHGKKNDFLDIQIFIRKDDDNGLPFAFCTFGLYYFSYIFMIPFSKDYEYVLSKNLEQELERLILQNFNHKYEKINLSYNNPTIVNVNIK